ncbi:MAG: phage portal protein, partial [Planctomycetaceae bacterium]|nr:phage portal protein [Planctomycetaceae bacterium]
ELKYDAIEETSRRKLPARDTRSEDRVLKIEQRDRLNSVSRDVRRNNLIGAWMIRKHQDFVSDIIIRVGGKDDGLKRTLDELIAFHTARDQFDIAGRFNLAAFVRIMEGGRTLEGDFGVLKLSSGHVQGIEADCIRDPRDIGIDQDEWHNGVRTAARGGRHLQYALHHRNRHGGFEFDKLVPARNFWLHGYFDRVNQVRGVTPLSTALNGLRYIYDLREFVHAKARTDSSLMSEVRRGRARTNFQQTDLRCREKIHQCSLKIATIQRPRSRPRNRDPPTLGTLGLISSST